MASTWQDFDKFMNYRRDRAGFQQWLIDSRAAGDGSHAQMEAFVAFLGPLFDYLAEGYRFKVLERRAWMLLYALRPDLIGGEDMVTAAKRWGVTKQAVHYQLVALHKFIPDLVVDTDTRKGHALDKAASNERHRVSNQRRWDRQKARREAARLEAFEQREGALVEEVA